MAGAAGATRQAGAHPPSRGTLFVERTRILAHDAHPGHQHVLVLEAPETAARALPGQFVHLSCDPALAMRRPMSIMRAHPARGSIEILYKVHGRGTRLLAARTVGEHLSLIGPIGVPFRLEGYRPRPVLLGGGVGIPPMLFLAEHMRRAHPAPVPLVLMGSEVPFPFTPRPSRLLVPGLPAAVIAAMPLLDDWGIASRLASAAGYSGCHEGFVTELARCWLDALPPAAHAEVELYACGPTAMLVAVQQLAAEYRLPCQISLEEYMACAVGGCAGCAVRIETPAGPAMKRVCVDGPVFEAASVRFGR
ncbi:MAG: dihydroorotate dehydrogenase electron transfer subunit [Gammaproteobacteria bacterium]|nr:dihydroorotate dehydrogenase electron transfer subunit [Gammaproteobacteria bacterium]